MSSIARLRSGLLRLHRISPLPVVDGRWTLVERPRQDSIEGRRTVLGTSPWVDSTARSHWSRARRRGSGWRASARFAAEGARVVGLDVDRAAAPTLDLPARRARGRVRAGRRARRGRDRRRDRRDGRRARPHRRGRHRGRRRGRRSGAPASTATSGSACSTSTSPARSCVQARDRAHARTGAVDGERGSVVTIASVEGLEGTAGGSSYNASKGAVVIFTKNLAIDYGRVGHPRQRDLSRASSRRRCSKACSACPGWRTCATTSARSTSCAGSAGPRRSRPSPLFLVSADASFVTGQAIAVDGGYTAGRDHGVTEHVRLVAWCRDAARRVAGGVRSRRRARRRLRDDVGRSGRRRLRARRRRVPGSVPVHARAVRVDVPLEALDDAHVRGLRHRDRHEPPLPRAARGGRRRPLDRVRPARR